VCLYVYPPIVSRQRLCKNITAATDTHATIEELLDASFYAVRVVSRKAGDEFFPELLLCDFSLFRHTNLQGRAKVTPQAAL
jgi:hypothetical protein